MSDSPTWKIQLQDRIPADLGHEIDVFEGQIELRKQGDFDEKLFAETRLRRGVYGQRYDNGQRFDGTVTKPLTFPEAETKGPDTVWHAPGMLRIKIPFGGLNPAQMETLADLAEEYSDEICHITTRQDVQLHFIHVEDSPDLMRRLAAVGVTTREACGNSVRNVTACPLSGVCTTESFDVTPYAKACSRFLLGHPDAQDFGRKFKIAFSGCKGEACGLTNMHDMGAIGVVRTVDGVEQRGFELYVDLFVIQLALAQTLSEKLSGGGICRALAVVPLELCSDFDRSQGWPWFFRNRFFWIGVAIAAPPLQHPRVLLPVSAHPHHLGTIRLSPRRRRTDGCRRSLLEDPESGPHLPLRGFRLRPRR
mgnify:CR=1 FL=1